jgi:hypothetical protein
MDNVRVRFFSSLGLPVSRTDHFSHSLDVLSSLKSIWPTTTLAMANAPPTVANAQEGAHPVRELLRAKSGRATGRRRRFKTSMSSPHWPKLWCCKLLPLFRPAPTLKLLPPKTRKNHFSCSRNRQSSKTWQMSTPRHRARDRLQTAFLKAIRPSIHRRP